MYEVIKCNLYIKKLCWIILRKLYICLPIAILGVCGGYYISKLLTINNYYNETGYYIYSASTDRVKGFDEGTASMYPSEVTMSNWIKTNYIAALSTDFISGYIKEHIETDCTAEEITNMIDCYTVEGVGVIYARVTGESPKLVNDIAYVLADQIPEYVNKLVRTGTIVTFEYPTDRTSVYTTSQTKKFVMLGGIVGFGIPFAICLFLGIKDPTIRKKDELEAITGKRVIAEIPDDKRETIYGSNMQQEIADVYANLRINMNKLIKKNAHCIIVMTSMESGSGKTLCSTNVALSQAAIGRKVLYISKELQDNILSCINDTSYNNTVKTHIYEDVVSCMKFISNVKEEYDIIIIDAPAIQEDETTYMLQDIADAYILIARSGSSSMLGQKNMLNILDSGCELVYGYILNGIKNRKIINK